MRVLAAVKNNLAVSLQRYRVDRHIFSVPLYHVPMSELLSKPLCNFRYTGCVGVKVQILRTKLGNGYAYDIGGIPVGGAKLSTTYQVQG